MEDQRQAGKHEYLSNTTNTTNALGVLLGTLGHPRRCEVAEEVTYTHKYELEEGGG